MLQANCLGASSVSCLYGDLWHPVFQLEVLPSSCSYLRSLLCWKQTIAMKWKKWKNCTKCHVSRCDVSKYSDNYCGALPCVQLTANTDDSDCNGLLVPSPPFADKNGKPSGNTLTSDTSGPVSTPGTGTLVDDSSFHPLWLWVGKLSTSFGCAWGWNPFVHRWGYSE